VMAVYRLLEPGEQIAKLRGSGSTKKATETLPIVKGALTGNLAQVPMDQLLGQLARSKANGVLTVEGEEGAITFVAGTPTDVRHGKKTGPAALQSFQKVPKGIFRFDPKPR
jgi:hypothetical protein